MFHFSTLFLLFIYCAIAKEYVEEKHIELSDYEYWCTGNCDRDVKTTPHPGIILMGGGTDVDEAFVQQIKWSDCGDFLVIRADRDKAYDKYVYDLSCANSAATLYIKNKNGANDDYVVQKVNDAEAIFFAGGDQTTYLEDWKGTKMQTAIQNAINNRNVPIGGTSAGCDVQSYWVYAASNGSATSEECLLNPFNQYMTFATHLVTQKYNLLNNTVIDTHFVTRARFGRLLAFVARLRTSTDIGSVGYPIRGIGINEQSAFAIDLETLKGRLLGPDKDGSEAYIIFPDEDPEICERLHPLTYQNVTVQKLRAFYNDTYDFGKWSGGRSSLLYNVSVVAGVEQQNPYVSPRENLDY